MGVKGVTVYDPQPAQYVDLCGQVSNEYYYVN